MSEDEKKRELGRLKAEYMPRTDHDLLTTLAAKFDLLSDDVKEVCTLARSNEKRITVVETTLGTTVKLLALVVPAVSGFVAWLISWLKS